MGVRGTVGRCYGFFADYKQCQVRRSQLHFTGAFVCSNNSVKPSLHNTQKEYRESFPDPSSSKKALGCLKEREDYFECLHSRKEYGRIGLVMQEKKKQEYEAKHGISESGH